MFGDEGFQSVRDQTLFGLCRYTVARISEVCQMKISDVFLPSGKVKAEIVFRTETTKGEYGLHLRHDSLTDPVDGTIPQVAGRFRAVLQVT